MVPVENELATLRASGDRVLALREEIQRAMAEMSQAAIDAAAGGADPGAIGAEYARLATPPSPPAEAPGTVRPVRTTVDLTPDMHRQLKQWAANAADELGVAELPLAEVFRALIRRLTTDPELSKAVAEDLRSRR